MKEIKNKCIGYRIMELRLDRGYSRERLEREFLLNSCLKLSAMEEDSPQIH